MAYISLYRKWRPQNFEDVVGQEYVTRTLANSVRNGNYAHAYLFSGPRGTGKTSTARILAKALNCKEGPTPNPCNRCPSCREITEGTSVDVIEIDAASNRGIEDIRDLRERVVFSPAASRVKVYILDEAHMLTKEANNALLKMLEEPPAHVVFVLATTEPHKMIPTILSRCQRFDFRSVPSSQLAKHLAKVAGEEKVEASEGALRLMARRARGSVRDALVVLEQVISYGDGRVDEENTAEFLGLIEDELLIELGDLLVERDAAGAVRLVERAYEEGRDLTQFAREAQEHFRHVYLLQHADLSPEELEVDEKAYGHIRRQADTLPPARTQQFVITLREAVREMQATPSPRLVLEAALIGMARSELDTSSQALLARLERLEDGVEKLMRREGATAVPAPPAARPRLPAGGEEEAEERPAEGGAPAENRMEQAPPLDLAAVRRAWPRIRERVKEKKVTTHAFLMEGKPQEIDGDELVISFPPGREFHKGEMEKEDHRKALEEALADVLGVTLKVRSRLEEEKAPRRPSATGKAGSRAGLEGQGAGAAGPEEGGGPGEGSLRGAEGPEESVEDVPEESPVPADDAGLEEIAAAGKAGKKEPERKGEKGDAGRGESPRGKTDTEGEAHDANKVKLVKDVFGAELIEEIRLGE